VRFKSTSEIRMERAWLDYLFRTTKLLGPSSRSISRTDSYVHLHGASQTDPLLPSATLPSASHLTHRSTSTSMAELEQQLIRKTFDPFPSRPSLQPLIPRIKPLTVAIKWRERSGLFRFRAPWCIVAFSRCKCHSPWSANPDACRVIRDLDMKSRRR